MKTPVKKKASNRISQTQQNILDKKHMGGEPIVSLSSSMSEVIEALNWHNYIADTDTHKEYMRDYLTAKGFTKLIANFNRMDAGSDYSLSICRVARLAVKSTSIPQTLQDKLDTFVTTLTKFQKPVKEVAPKPTPVVKINRYENVIADIEDILDGPKSSIYDYLTQKEVPKAAIPFIVEKYKPLHEELQTVYDKKDAELALGYKHLTRPALRAFLEYVKAIISDAERYADNQKVARKPRKKKVKKASDILKHFQYKVSYDAAKVISIKPENILDATELYVYNTKYKTLIAYYAKAGEKLSVHRTAITNYDETKSVAKKAGRKEQAAIDAVINGTKLSSRKVFDTVIKTQPCIFSGRIGDDVVLLRAFK